MHASASFSELELTDYVTSIREVSPQNLVQKVSSHLQKVHNEEVNQANTVCLSFKFAIIMQACSEFCATSCKKRSTFNIQSVYIMACNDFNYCR